MEKIKIVLAVLLFFPLCAFSQGTEQSQPPVDIEFIAPGNPHINQGLTITIKVTPQKDINARLSCLLPIGVEPIKQKGAIILPYWDVYFFNKERKDKYLYAAELSLGLLKAGSPKEFAFRVKVSQKGSYEFLAILDAFSRGKKEKVFLVEIN